MRARALSVTINKRFLNWAAIAFALVFSIGLSLQSVQAADSNEPQPVKAPLPTDFDPKTKFTAHATLMSDDERNSFYLKWGLIFVGGTGAAIALAIWLFSSSGKPEPSDTAEEIEKTAQTNSQTQTTDAGASMDQGKDESAKSDSKQEEIKTETVAASSVPATGDEGAGI